MRLVRDGDGSRVRCRSDRTRPPWRGRLPRGLPALRSAGGGRRGRLHETAWCGDDLAAVGPDGNALVWNRHDPYDRVGAADPRRGLRWAELGVDDNDSRPRALYERLGYVVSGSEIGSWDQDAVDGSVTRYETPITLMRKELI